jgi:predicted branched-subunit amino acid permease
VIGEQAEKLEVGNCAEGERERRAEGVEAVLLLSFCCLLDPDAAHVKRKATERWRLSLCTADASSRFLFCLSAFTSGTLLFCLFLLAHKEKGKRKNQNMPGLGLCT